MIFVTEHDAGGELSADSSTALSDFSASLRVVEGVTVGRFRAACWSPGDLVAIALLRRLDLFLRFFSSLVAVGSTVIGFSSLLTVPRAEIDGFDVVMTDSPAPS